MKKASGIISLLLITGIFSASAEKAFTYRENFEDSASVPKVYLWAKNGTCDVNYLGLSDEKACAGKKSLKLDITITDGSYFYWGADLKVPCEGKLRMTARLFIAEGSDAQVGFGSNFVFPPTALSGCGAVETVEGTAGQWKTIECDLVKQGKGYAFGVLDRHAPSIKAENAGVVLDKWSLFVYGGKGKRAVVYLDDIKIEGEAPAYDTYEKELALRWEKVRQKWVDSIDLWRNRMSSGDSEIARYACPEGAGLRAMCAATIKVCDKCRDKGYCDAGEEQTIQATLAALSQAPKRLAAIVEARKKKQAMLVFTPQAITDALWPSNRFPFTAPLGDTLVASACRTEYEPFTALLYALEPVQSLEVTVSDLTAGKNVIPADSIDLRAVKCWFKAAGRVNDPSSAGYFPELLVKDDSLVLVDTGKKENRLCSTAPDGTKKYLLCSGKTSDNLADVRPMDAPTLRPINVPQNFLQQFWFTIHVPDSAKACTYRGKVTFRGKGAKQTVPVAMTVHAFDLQPAGMTYSLYYRGTLSPMNAPSVSSELKSEEQYRAEMADLRAHGVLFPTNYQGFNERLLTRVLEIRREIGLPAGLFFNLGSGTGSATESIALAFLGQQISQWIDFVKPYGYNNVYFYGADEAMGERLTNQRKAWKAVQDAGGKTFVACGSDAYDSMGGLLNCAVLGGKPDPEEAKKWHRAGSQAFCYSYPQVGEIVPETYRRHFGLELWKAGYDGAMDYAYQHGFGHIWNDFDGSSYRDLCFAYPTINGIVPTIQWEGFREAVDDIRYMTTLEKALASAPAAKKEIAEKASAWLNALDPETADLYRTRAEMAEWITKLTEKR